MNGPTDGKYSDDFFKLVATLIIGDLLKGKTCKVNYLRIITENDCNIQL